jgi:hypothetical protein
VRTAQEGSHDPHIALASSHETIYRRLMDLAHYNIPFPASLQTWARA